MVWLVERRAGQRGGHRQELVSWRRASPRGNCRRRTAPLQKKGTVLSERKYNVKNTGFLLDNKIKVNLFILVVLLKNTSSHENVIE